MFFLFAGEAILKTLHITGPALTIAGGVVLFLIAIKMIFASAKDIFPQNPEGEPWIVPLAIPFVAGPSAVATVLLLMAREPARWLDWLIALVAAWLIAGTILLFSTELNRWLGDRGLNAVERLMGLLLTTVAIQMFLSGIADFLASLPASADCGRGARFPTCPTFSCGGLGNRL